jgi:hypothetical protein
MRFFCLSVTIHVRAGRDLISSACVRRFAAFVACISARASCTQGESSMNHAEKGPTEEGIGEFSHRYQNKKDVYLALHSLLSQPVFNGLLHVLHQLVILGDNLRRHKTALDLSGSQRISN